MKRYLVFLLLSGSAFCADDMVSGKWKIDGDVAGTTFSESCTLKLDGAKVTGKCMNDDQKSYDVTGDVDGQKVVFQHGGEYNGDPLTLVYTGNLDTDGNLKGTIDVQPMSVSGDFTAKKDK